jgi:hypothetical protein
VQARQKRHLGQVKRPCARGASDSGFMGGNAENRHVLVSVDVLSLGCIERGLAVWSSQRLGIGSMVEDGALGKQRRTEKGQGCVLQR